MGNHSGQQRIKHKGVRYLVFAQFTHRYLDDIG